MKDVVKQVLVGAVGAILAVVIFGVWTWVYGGGMIRIIGGLTEDKLSDSETIQGINTRIEENNETLESMRKILGPHDRIIHHESFEVQGGGPWGGWHEATYCPVNYYVCGLEQKVEGPQGGGIGEDDTALNAVALRCCSLQSETLE